jgi:NusA-like KH domain protein
MGNILDMQFMRYLNLFARITRVQTTTCFVYNNIIVFGVKERDISNAIGRNAENVRKIAEILRRKIKIVGMPSGNGARDIENFVKEVVSPLVFTKFEFQNRVVSLSGTMQNKAGLIGRNSVRQKELEDILKRYFDVEELRIA